jgi:hypothetical protein
MVGGPLTRSCARTAAAYIAETLPLSAGPADDTGPQADDVRVTGVPPEPVKLTGRGAACGPALGHLHAAGHRSSPIIGHGLGVMLSF